MDTKYYQFDMKNISISLEILIVQVVDRRIHMESEDVIDVTYKEKKSLYYFWFWFNSYRNSEKRCHGSGVNLWIYAPLMDVIQSVSDTTGFSRIQEYPIFSNDARSNIGDSPVITSLFTNHSRKLNIILVLSFSMKNNFRVTMLIYHNFLTFFSFTILQFKKLNSVLFVC